MANAECFRALERGATLITSTTQLTRATGSRYSEWARERGIAIWKTPDILPLSAFLRRAWKEWVYGADGPCPTLLNPTQSAVVWEKAIRAGVGSDEGHQLLQTEEAAQAAVLTWAAIQAYGIALEDGRFASTEDGTVFRDWATAYERHCAEREWIDEARLPDAITDLLRRGALRLPGPFLFAGFDEVTPQLRALMSALPDVSVLSQTPLEAVLSKAPLRDNTSEVRSAAEWARTVLASNPEARIGVIIPGLKHVRKKVQRIFREVLHPDKGCNISGEAFAMPAGPLADEPLIDAALTALKFVPGEMLFHEASGILRSPFLSAAQSEMRARAVDDVRARREAKWMTSTGIAHGNSQRAGELSRILAKFAQTVDPKAEPQAPGKWSSTFARALEALGWPGERELNAREQRAVGAWRDLLSRFATLDLVVDSFTADEALRRLRRLAAATRFDNAVHHTPVQILEPLEARGLQFDALWIAGLHEGAFRSDTDAFLPLSIQVEKGMRGATPERRVEAAERLFAELTGSALQVVVSWPQMEGEQTLSASPLLQQCIFFRELADAPRAAVVTAPMETREDWQAPAVVEGTKQFGGSALFKDMSACFFRAFATHRLGARTLDAPEFGVTRRDKGKAVHVVLQQIWNHLQNHRALRAMPRWDLCQLVADKVREAIDPGMPLVFRQAEQQRLEELLLRWLDLEAERVPFTVRESERKRDVQFAGLNFELRMDRVDALESDGRHVIIDYKTGQWKPKCWIGERPDEPQLPLYCVAFEGDVAALAFARLCADDLGFRGAVDRTELPEFTPVEKATPLRVLRDDWATSLTHLAQQYREGMAPANPKESACQFCGLEALCRIREMERV